MKLRERLAEVIWHMHDWAWNTLPWDETATPHWIAFRLLDLSDWIQGEGPGPNFRYTPEELAEQERQRNMTAAEWEAEFAAGRAVLARRDLAAVAP